MSSAPETGAPAQQQPRKFSDEPGVAVVTIRFAVRARRRLWRGDEGFADWFERTCGVDLRPTAQRVLASQTAGWKHKPRSYSISAFRLPGCGIEMMLYPASTKWTSPVTPAARSDNR